jgi:hypothetical protein
MSKRERRGLGPFSGAQLTIVIVAVAAMFALPTAAIAAGGAFTSNTTKPTVSATNSSKADGAVAVYGKEIGVGKKVRFGVRGAANGKGGVGVEGAGSKYGVFSNGPFAVTGDATINGNLQVSSGKSFACDGCVGPKALSGAARIAKLLPGESQTGVFSVSDGYPVATPASLTAPLPFDRPVSGTLTYQVLLAAAPRTANCPGVGSAARGFVCVYDTADQDVATPTAAAIKGTNGGFAQWTELGGGTAVARGSYTVTAP